LILAILCLFIHSHVIEITLVNHTRSISNTIFENTKLIAVCLANLVLLTFSFLFESAFPFFVGTDFATFTRSFSGKKERLCSSDLEPSPMTLTYECVLYGHYEPSSHISSHVVSFESYRPHTYRVRQ